MKEEQVRGGRRPPFIGVQGIVWRSETAGRQPAMYQFLSKLDCLIGYR